MSVLAVAGRVGAALLLFLSCLACREPAARAEALRLDVCAAIVAEPVPEDAWPGPGGLRPGEAVFPGDRGLGCRFLLEGEPGGEAVTVEARIWRPAVLGRGEVAERWFVPVRRGEPAVAVYAFGALPPEPGTWTLELVREGRVLADRKFEVASGPASPPPAPADGSGKALAPAPPARSPLPPAPSRPRPAAAGPAQDSLNAAKPDASRPAASPASSRAASFALQTGTFVDADRARAQVALLRERGVPACVSVDGSGGRKRHRVLAGRFADRQAALAGRDRIAAIVGGNPLPVAARGSPPAAGGHHAPRTP